MSDLMDDCTFYEANVEGAPALVRCLAETFSDTVSRKHSDTKTVVIVIEGENGSVSTYAWGETDHVRVLGLLAQSQRTVMTR